MDTGMLMRGSCLTVLAAVGFSVQEVGAVESGGCEVYAITGCQSSWPEWWGNCDAVCGMTFGSPYTGPCAGHVNGSWIGHGANSIGCEGEGAKWWTDCYCNS
jgi:hypothetical protein